MITTTARTQDHPMPIGDAADVLLTVPRGLLVELRAGPDGTTLVCRTAATADAAGQPTRAQAEDANAAALRRHAAAAGGAR